MRRDVNSAIGGRRAVLHWECGRVLGFWEVEKGDEIAEREEEEEEEEEVACKGKRMVEIQRGKKEGSIEGEVVLEV